MIKKHDPGEHRQALEVAVEALVLAHDVARGFKQGAQGLGSGGYSGLDLLVHRTTCDIPRLSCPDEMGELQKPVDIPLQTSPKALAARQLGSDLMAQLSAQH